MTAFLVEVLKTFNGWFGNYAFAIILLTLLVKLVLMPLDVMSRKNMRKNALLQPKIDALKKKYGKDPQKLQEKQMELYKKEKFNPFMGCLPLLLQFPVLIIMYNSVKLLADAQLAQMFDIVSHGDAYTLQSFFWVHNLWQPDSIQAPIFPTMQAVNLLKVNNGLNWTSLYDPTVRLLSADHVALIKSQYETVMAPLVQQFSGNMNGYAILPIVSAAISFLSTKLQPKQPEPEPDPKRKQGGMGNMMKYMNYFFPLMMAYFCWTSSAAFAIYWTFSSVIEIAKQLLFRVIFPDPNKGKGEPVDDEVVVIN